jgi:hypothetical protein
MKKKKYSFPLIQGNKMMYPKKGGCPVCGKKMHGNFVVLHAGAMLMDRKKNSGTMSDDLDGFMRLYWHGKFEGTEIYTGIDLSDNVVGGQCEFYFCTPACLKIFFNDCIDSLVQKMKKDRLTVDKKRYSKTKTKQGEVR